MKKYLLLFAVVLTFALGGCADLAAKLCTVTFDTNGVGENPKPLIVESGAKLSAEQLPALPETDGKIFGGWFKESACTNQWKKDSDTVTKNITLYAKWSEKPIPGTPLTPAIKRYTVKFDTQGIASNPSDIIIEEGKLIPASQFPTVSASKKRFDGWYKEPAGTNKWDLTGDTVMQNITLYAKWTSLYAVSFDARKIYTQSIAPVTVADGDSIPAGSLPSPSHLTWDFDGWYRDKTCMQAWIAADTVTADMTLYAKWMPKSIEAQDLWKSKDSNGPDNYFRIPALAETKDGTLIAVTDLRYGHAADIGKYDKWGKFSNPKTIHRVDLLIKMSNNFGKTWSSPDTNLTNVPSNPVQYGCGDAAIVADRESNTILVLYVQGDERYQDGKQSIYKLKSTNGGNTWIPEDLTDQIYRKNSHWKRMFITSGKIHQSRYIKISNYYRIYAAPLIADFGNTVLYSDDFGDNWSVLGTDSTVRPIANGDEAKVEELPDGRVLLSSRTQNGRLINIFTYTDKASGTGSWETQQRLNLGADGGTNGEVLILQAVAVNDNDKKPINLAMLSFPKEANRKNVTIFWRTISANETLDGFTDTGKWAEKVVHTGTSAYSTMVQQKDGRIGFLYERNAQSSPAGYDIRYESLTLHDITGGQYEAAFLSE